MTKAELERQIEELKKDKAYLIGFLGEIELYTSKDPMDQFEIEMKEKYNLEENTYKWYLCDFHLERILSVIDKVKEWEKEKRVEAC